MQGDRQRALIIAETAAFIGLIAIGGWISIPFLPVPLTLQTMFVLLAAMVMKDMPSFLQHFSFFSAH